GGARPAGSAADGAGPSELRGGPARASAIAALPGERRPGGGPPPPPSTPRANASHLPAPPSPPRPATKSNDGSAARIHESDPPSAPSPSRPPAGSASRRRAPARQHRIAQAPLVVAKRIIQVVVKAAALLTALGAANDQKSSLYQVSQLNQLGLRLTLPPQAVVLHGDLLHPP